MFDDLTNKLKLSFNKLKTQGKITEESINEALKEVKISFLEADVNYRVVNAFLKSVKKQILGEKIIGSLTPAQQFIKVINTELVKLLGDSNENIQEASKGMTGIMLVGLQGSGKTTSCAKLAGLLKTSGRNPYLVPLDIYRPAAIKQLQVLADSLNLKSYETEPDQKLTSTASDAMKEAQQMNATHIIFDTAGRLQIDEAMMDELLELKKLTKPTEILLVLDAMTGQEAINVAKAFDAKLDITGFILTKLDGDARAGAALSIRSITEKPVKFVGSGEKLTDLEFFHPDRIASKILGMGDIMTLIEKAQSNIDESTAQRLEENLKKNQFTLEDFQTQITQIKKMGPLKDLLKMIPGIGANLPGNLNIDDNHFNKINAIISSMTTQERRDHTILNRSRKIRVASGSGTQVSDINKLIKDFIKMKSMMKNFVGSGGKNKAMKEVQKMMGNRSGGGRMFP